MQNDETIIALERKIAEMKFAEAEEEKKFWQVKLARKHKFLWELIASLPKTLKQKNTGKGYPLTEEGTKVYLTKEGFSYESGEKVSVSNSQNAKTETQQKILKMADDYERRIRQKLKKYREENFKKVRAF